MKLYHGTNFDNLGSILTKGLISKYEGVYLTDSRESAMRWVGFRLKAMGASKMVVIEVEVNEDDIEDGVDHSPAMVEIFGVGKSLLHTKSIDRKCIKNVYQFDLE
jgi:RNA:NAD 2'-phosphotransferase (TPT1/KptA family)